MNQARPLRTIALIGNPNTGKSTLFSALCGVRQQTGNYPGVTVEKKLGTLPLGEGSLSIIDLPGTYSLAARSPDEFIAVEVLLGQRDEVELPDAVLCIVDASNLERNLYLVGQILELERPVVVALNKMDLAEQQGLRIDVAGLSERLGVPVVPIEAHRKRGLDELKRVLRQDLAADRRAPASPFPEAFQREVTELMGVLQYSNGKPISRFFAERLLLDSFELEQRGLRSSEGRDVGARIAESRERLAAAGISVPAVEAISRYQWVDRMVAGLIERQAQATGNWTDRMDTILTHRIFGTLIFAGMMLLVFQAIFSWAGPLMELIEGAVESLGGLASQILPTGMLQSLVVDGIVAGVGGVLVFLPQIFILFFFIAVLEDCGYMARAAYLMDRLMSRIGLSGKSFIPLLSSFACAIPGIMATRVIENRRDRLITILVAPLMSCSARLPVYVLLISAFVPAQRYVGGWLGLQGLTMFAMYLLGIVAAIAVAFILRNTLLKGQAPPFVMELPRYKFPSPRLVLFRMLDRGWAFVRRAGTLILAVTIVVWAAAYFPHDPEVQQQVEQQYADQLAALDQQIRETTDEDQQASLQTEREALEDSVADQVQGAYIRQSILGRLGRILEPAVRPLGWDWKIGAAVVASFPAREVVIGTMGVIYNLGDDEDESSTSLAEKLQAARWPDSDRPVFNLPVALSIMVFFALCAQCAATLVVIRRETNSWRWPVFTFVYMTGLAYVAALLTYQIGIRWG